MDTVKRLKIRWHRGGHSLGGYLEIAGRFKQCMLDHLSRRSYSLKDQGNVPNIAQGMTQRATRGVKGMGRVYKLESERRYDCRGFAQA